MIKNFASIAVTLLIFSFQAQAVVENSIIPLIERFEQIDNIPRTKYSSRQYSEIASSLSRKKERIRIVSYNVLFDLYDENLEEVNRWPQRLPKIVELIHEMDPDILSVQELYPNQYKDLMPYLEGAFSFYSKPSEEGELSGIFYKKDRFEVVGSQVWPMAETTQPSSAETLTMLQLKDLKTGRVVAIFNTHLSFSKIDKRDFQARFIAEQLEPFTKKMAVILTGDFNTFPSRLDLEKLPFYDGDYVHRLLTKGSMKDANHVSVLGHLGPLSTFSNSPEETLPFKGTGTPGIFLDHIYVSQGIRVLLHAVQSGTVDGHFPSDHFPVIADFILD